MFLFRLFLGSSFSPGYTMGNLWLGLLHLFTDRCGVWLEEECKKTDWYLHWRYLPLCSYTLCNSLEMLHVGTYSRVMGTNADIWWTIPSKNTLTFVPLALPQLAKKCCSGVAVLLLQSYLSLNGFSLLLYDSCSSMTNDKHPHHGIETNDCISACIINSCLLILINNISGSVERFWNCTAYYPPY